MQYAKPAAVLRMYERYLSQLFQTDYALPLVLRVRLGGTAELAMPYLRVHLPRPWLLGLALASPCTWLPPSQQRRCPAAAAAARRASAPAAPNRGGGGPSRRRAARSPPHRHAAASLPQVMLQKNAGGQGSGTTWPVFFQAAQDVLGTNTNLIKARQEAALASGTLDAAATAAARAALAALTKQQEVFELRTGAFMRSQARAGRWVGTGVAARASGAGAGARGRPRTLPSTLAGVGAPVLRCSDGAGCPARPVNPLPRWAPTPPFFSLQTYDQAMEVIDRAYETQGEQPTLATWFYM